MNKSHEFPIDSLEWRRDSEQKDIWLPRMAALLVFAMMFYHFNAEKRSICWASVSLDIENSFPLQSILSGFALMNITNHCWESNASTVNRSCLPTRSLSLSLSAFVCVYLLSHLLLFVPQRKERLRKKVPNSERICGKPQWFFDRISKCV